VAKTRAQRKAERRKREQRQAAQGRPSTATAQHDTQVPESANVLEAELAEQGADVEALREEGERRPEAPAPSRADVGQPAEAEAEVAEERPTRRERRRAEREERQRAKQSAERRRPREEPTERQRGRVIGFLVSCWAELKRVQWPDRDTLIQASAVTLIFIAVAAAYLGVLDAVFNQVVQLIL
jgi:preprotein translocase SecE subunit